MSDMLHNGAGTDTLTIQLVGRISTLVSEVEGLRRNLEEKNSTIMRMSLATEYNELALKFALACAAQSGCKDPVATGFELANEYLTEIKTREELQ